MDFLKKRLKRVTSMGLALLLSASALPVTAFAASDSTSTLAEVTAKYIDAENGKEIIQSETYSVTHEEKSPQEIENYTYVDYTESVEYVYSHKDLTYIIGYPDESVRPDASMTRAEAATVFYRLYDGEYPAFTRRMSNGTFEDVKADYWFYKEVETLYNIGIVDGMDEHTFAPDAPVTRAEFAVMAARFANLDYEGGNIFDDVPTGHWAYSYINAAANAGWVEGYPDGSFRPDEPISRAEVVTLVNGVINRSVTLGKLKELGVKCPYNDLVENHWGYCDLMEATVPHSAEEWHGLSYNDGIYNIIVEKFVDQNGVELAESVTTAGKEEVSPKAIPAYEYRGYIRTITYQYTNGDAIPSIEKTINVKTANVGDPLTYTVKLSNNKSASPAWKEVVLTDDLPDGLTFVDSSVYVDGKSAEHSFKDGVLSVAVGDIMQGKYIVNTAILADGDDQTPLPDAGVQIDEGEADPIVTKSASTSEANVGDTFRYEITVKNGDKATAPWKNVVAYDTLPAGVKLIGNVYLDGKVALHKLSGNALSVRVGDLAAGESVTVSFDVQVVDSAAGTTLQNSVDVSGDNGGGTATDDGVTVPEEEPQNPNDTTGFYVTKDVDKTVVNVSKDVSNGLKTVTFTIVVGNNSSETWTNVVLKDALDTSMLTPILQNNVYVDGVLNQDWSFADKVFSLELGDIEPSQFRTVVVAVQFKADAGGTTYVNYATGEGDNGNATGKSPEIEIVSVVDDPITDIHYQLYNGYGENMWRPGDRISLQEACTVAYRLISNGGNTWLERGTVTVPDYEFSIPEEAKYFVSIGVLPASVFDTTKMTEDVDYEINYEVSEKGYLRIWATSEQLNTLVKYITGTNAGLSGDVSRLNFAKLICQLTGRDTDPDTSAYSGHIQYFTDSGSSVGLITEVSHEHDYVLDADGNEYWIVSVK